MCTSVHTLILSPHIDQTHTDHDQDQSDDTWSKDDKELKTTLESEPSLVNTLIEPLENERADSSC